MNNGCNEISDEKIADREGRAKKLNRYVTDVARRVTDAKAASQSVADLFTINIEVQHQKLRDNCEKLFFLDIVNYGKKSLELLWRKVYYETISTAKKLRDPNIDYDAALNNHIVCGISNFHHIITRIQTEININFNELDFEGQYKDDETGEISKVHSEEEVQCAHAAMHSCLIYLGDLCRYQTELFQDFDPSISARYYLQAAHIDLASGMPYNQLGNLYLDKNHNLDSVCFYIHCLNCTAPFEGAMGNVLKIFEKNAQFCETISDPDTLTPAEHVQYTIANFLSLIEIWYFGKNYEDVAEKCNNIAHELKIALNFNKPTLPDINKNYKEYVQAIEEENINPSYFTSNLIHRITSICLFTIAKISESDESKAFACKAFTLALLSQLLQKLLKQVEAFGFNDPAYKPANVFTDNLCPKKSEEPIEITDTDTTDETIVNGNSNKNNISKVGSLNNNLSDDNDEDDILDKDNEMKNNAKKSLLKRRRRRRAASDSTDASDVDTSDSSESVTDAEEGTEEELSNSTYQSDASKSDNSDSEADEKHETDNIEAEKDKETSDEEIKPNSHVNGNLISTEKNLKLNEFDSKSIQNFLMGDNFLPSLKLLQDWVLNDKDLILSCGESGESLFQCVVDLLNIFQHYFDPDFNQATKHPECKVLEYAKSIAKSLNLEHKTIPLPEDINLRGTNICKFDENAAEWQVLNKFKPSVYEENVMRILHFIDFGNQIAQLVPNIKYNRNSKTFYLKIAPPPKLSTKIAHKKTRDWHNSKKQHGEGSEGGLLRRLGRLWLTSQVRELERGQTAAPALLALDTAALNKHLRRVKQLLRARNFILLIPNIVVQELDGLKKEQITARDAIRWLEMQLKSGSRFLKAQKPGQAKPLALLKYPRKAPLHVNNFIQILEFCNHFVADEKQSQGGNGDPDATLHGKSAPLLILLVGTDAGEEEPYKEFSLMGAAQSAGISVQHIGEFYTKWRQTIHKGGKKR